MPLPDSDTLQSLGGFKQNYDLPEDTTTDWDALNLDMAFCDVAQGTYTANNAWIRFTTSADGYTPSLVNWRSSWMVNTPTQPVLAWVSTGIYTITLPTTVLDELNGIQNTYYPAYNPSHTINVLRATASVEGSIPLHVQCSFNANVITMYVFNMTGTLTDAQFGNVGSNILVVVQ